MMVTVCVKVAADALVGISSLTGSFQRCGQTDESLRRVAYEYEREAGTRNLSMSSHVPRRDSSKMRNASFSCDSTGVGLATE
jgi:hypothetical protein